MPRSETGLIARTWASLRSQIASGRIAGRHLVFFSLWILGLMLLRAPLIKLVNLALDDERYTSILLAPVVSVFVIYLQRKRIFVSFRWGFGVGIALVLVGISLLSLERDSLSVNAFAIVLVWAALFVLCYGMQAFHRAILPFLFLLLMVPIPQTLMESAVFALQKASADVSYGLFKLTGTPVFRDGFRFSLPGVEIEVAEECSGIRSSLSIAICSILAGQMFLRSKWSQLWFTLLTVPIVIFKNAVRIVTISWLGVYVDRGFLFGNLHRYGGLPFSIIAFAILFGVLVILQRSESGREQEAAI